MKSNWLIKEQFPERSAELAREVETSPLVAQLLINRGIETGETAERFLGDSFTELPSPFLMAGMEDAVDRIEKAVGSGEVVAVYGDYDADGVTSTSLLCDFLKALDVDTIYFAPHRIKDGYGINSRAVEELGRRGATLIISTDCGITALDEVENAKELGIDFIVTDHHLPGDEIPDAVAVVNPKLPGCDYPEKNIAGVGVAFNLALAVRARLREKGFFDSRTEPNMAHYLDLVAIGTVTDRVPLTGANRIMVKEGIKRMKTPDRPGIEALKTVSRINGGFNSGDIAYRMGPRINAAGRIDGPEIAVELLLSESAEHARTIAKKLDERNRTRQELERKAVAEAIEFIEQNPDSAQSACLVVSSQDWHPGITGPLASRLVEKYSKPAFAIAIDSDGIGKGSGRTVPAVNLYETLRACDKSLERYGGHAMAAGITVRSESIDLFRSEIDKHIKSTGAGTKPGEKTFRIDARIGIESLTLKTVKEFEILEPFGSGNPTPVFLIEGAKIISHNVIKNAHLKLFLDTGEGGAPIEAMWWNAADGVAAPEGKADIVFSPEISVWKNRESLTLRIIDLERI
ncbi:MAG: single-stranded-DNA-specific exonuclease RecJ [Candidatus Mycalebacterium zealandia]|nr:MAG: single-stranded-DNA-specific exonuclease RecJ [Candidatus Mycalebacterium zealandia]